MAHRVRHGGAWRDTVQPSIRHGGTWRSATDAWIRHGGAWEKWWPDGDRAGPYLFGSISSVGPNVCRWDGSVWDSVGGGPGHTVTKAAINDDYDLLVSNGGSSHYWNGSSWTSIAPSFYNTHTGPITSDGTKFYTARYTAGFDPVTLWEVTLASQVSGQTLQTFSGVTTASVSQLAYGPYGGYIIGNFDNPVYSPAGIETGESIVEISPIGTVAMGRQLDGAVWTGALSGDSISVETAFDTWSAVGVPSGGSATVVLALPDSTAYVAGTFTSISSVPCAGVAYWDGSTWSEPFTLSNVIGMSYHRGLVWILQGATSTARKVYTWDGSTLTEQSDWAGDTVLGIL